MKLLELEIKNIRGIKDITLHPNGKNYVIYGKNGSGKSAVVDAIDFLLTGQIMRLMGEGTKNITLRRHGAHIDCTDPTAAFVRGLIKVRGSKEPIELLRFIDKPNEIVIPEEKVHLIQPIIDIAKRGQHVLTRREIFKIYHSRRE